MRPTMLLACAFTLAAPALAQKPADEPTSIVSGRVFCADTNAPARMATVMLEPVEATEVMSSGESRHISFHGEQVHTLLDGSFTIRHVEPGTYYVVVSQPGYLSTLTPLRDPDLMLPAAPREREKKPAFSAPRITVQSGHPVAVNVTLERGASVSGTVLFDDGSPAIGISVAALSFDNGDWVPLKSPQPFGGPLPFVSTDDLGTYRITGLPPGKYLVQAQLSQFTVTFQYDAGGGSMSSSNSGSNSPVHFYSGNKTRQKDVVPVSLSAGEERRGEDIEIPLSKLHIIRGSITAARDGHVLNAGTAQLEYAEDKSFLSAATLAKGDEEFTFSYVPEGDYLLHVDGAADVDYVEKPNPPGFLPPNNTEPRILRTYGSAEQLIHVTGDLTGIVISVPDQQSGSKSPPPAQNQ